MAGLCFFSREFEGTEEMKPRGKGGRSKMLRSKTVLDATWGPPEGTVQEAILVAQTRIDGEIQTQSCSLHQLSHADLSSAVQPFLSPIPYTDLAVTSWEQYPENEVRLFNKVTAAGREPRAKHNREGVWGMDEEREG